MEQEATASAFVPMPMAAILKPDDAGPEPRDAGQASAAPEAPVVAETGEPEPQTDRPRDERGKFASKATEEAPPASEKEPSHVPVAALKDERSKRQQVEAEFNRLRQEYAAAMQRIQAGQPPAPQPVQQQQPQVDEFGQLMEAPGQFVGQQVQRAVAPLQEQMVMQRVALSRDFIASTAADYEAAESALFAYAQANPQVAATIRDTIRSHPNPAKWALEQGRALLRQQQWASVLQQYPDPDAFLKARAAATQPAPEEPASSPPRSLPASLAASRSSAPRTAQAWSGPTPLSAILGPRSAPRER